MSVLYSLMLRDCSFFVFLINSKYGFIMRGAEMRELYSYYLLTTCGYATATGFSAITEGDIGHDSVTRFLSSNNFSSKDLWSLVKKSVKSIGCDSGVLVVDDTIEEKRHTNENDIVCWHWYHSKGQNAKDINILNILINDNGKSLPIAYEIIKKDEKFIDKDGKNKRRSKISKNEMLTNFTGILQGKHSFPIIVYNFLTTRI